MTYAEKLKHPKWQKKRLEALNNANFTCQFCGETEKTLHVHHLLYHKGRQPWEYHSLLLNAICEDCHAVHHNKNVHPIIKDLLEVLTMNPKKFGEATKVINKLILLGRYTK